MSFVPRTDINKEYQDGATIRELSLRHGVAPVTVRKHIVCVRPQGNRRHYSVNEKAFDSLTPESAYWLGFILADGCVTQPARGQKMLLIKLQKRDKGHLKKFLNFLEATYPIHHERTQDCVEVRIPSDRITRALAGYGIVERKSTTAIVVPRLQNNRDFWRGVIDGDGCLAIKKSGPKYRYYNVKLCGTKEVCTAFSRYVHSLGNREYRVHKIRGTECHDVTVSSHKEAKNITNVLYAESLVELTRKAKIAADWMEE